MSVETLTVSLLNRSSSPLVVHVLRFLIHKQRVGCGPHGQAVLHVLEQLRGMNGLHRTQQCHHKRQTTSQDGHVEAIAENGNIVGQVVAGDAEELLHLGAKHCHGKDSGRH